MTSDNDNDVKEDMMNKRSMDGDMYSINTDGDEMKKVHRKKHSIYDSLVLLPNDDANFATTMTNLIATKAGLTSNTFSNLPYYVNTTDQLINKAYVDTRFTTLFTGSNTFSNLPYYINTSDQLINKNYVDTRFTNLLSNNNTFTGSNTFNSSSGNIIDRLFSVNNNFIS